MTDKLSIIPRMAIILPFIYMAGLFNLISYYNEFGFRYSELSLEYYHVFHRGMILLYTDFAAFVLLLIVFLGAIFSSSNYQIRLPIGYRKVSTISEICIAIAFVVVWPIAAIDGFHSAQRDSVPSTTQLRRLAALKDSRGSTLQVFAELAKSDGRIESAPTIFVFRKTESQLSVIVPPAYAQVGAIRVAVYTIRLNSGDYYVETPSSNRNSVPFWCPFC